ncbi:MAG: hypothetical protein AAB790_03700 [Patescibacteria group bacterium]
MSDLDDGNGDNGDIERPVKDEITRELQEVQQMLSDLEAMLPRVHDDVGLINANIERVREQLSTYDDIAERMRESGELQEGMAMSRAIGKVMINIEDGLKRLMEDKELALSTRMSIENSIEELRETREDLLLAFPEDKKQ